MPPLYKMAIGKEITVIFYPDAHPEETSVDGWVQRSGFQLTWADIHSGAGNQSWDDINHSWAGFTCHTAENTWATLGRTILLFDTSSIPPGATIMRATFCIFGNDKLDIISANPTLNLFASSPASNIALVPADYQQIATIPLSTPISYAAFNTLGYNSLPLNPYGLTLIQKQGITKLALREAKYDVSGIRPPWASPGYAGFEFWTSEEGEGYKPKLTVTYKI